MSARKAVAKPLSSFDRKETEWLSAAPGRVPLGAVTLLSGPPGLGKSLLTLSWAAALSREGEATLLLSAEDDPSATIRPRLEALGADIDLIQYVSMQNEHDGLEDSLRLPEDGDRLASLTEEADAKLVVVDPIMAHLGGRVNSWNDQQVRAALAPLYRLAIQSGIAIIVVGHLNKSDSADPIRRAGGSTGFSGLARSMLVFASDPDDQDGPNGTRRVLAHSKSNVSALAASQVYEVEPITLEASGAEPAVETARIVFVGESQRRADELLETVDSDGREDRSDAEQFLLAELASGPRPATELLRSGHAHGINDKALRKAKRTLRVSSEKTGMGGGWVWRLNGHSSSNGAVPPDWRAELEEALA